MYAWRRFVAGNIDEAYIKGHHIGVLIQPHVKDLAQRVQGALDEAMEKLDATESD